LGHSSHEWSSFVNETYWYLFKDRFLKKIKVSFWMDSSVKSSKIKYSQVYRG